MMCIIIEVFFQSTDVPLRIYSLTHSLQSDRYRVVQNLANKIAKSVVERYFK